MSRTHLHATIRRMVRIAQTSLRAGSPTARELHEREQDRRISRRNFLATGGSAALGLAIAGGCRSAESTSGATDGRSPRGDMPARNRRNGPKVAIVGAGLAGLTAAHEFRKEGIRATIFESSNRAGGRVFTARDIMGPGLTTELGGEFIDSSHADLLALVREFHLDLIDTRNPEESAFRETYYFSGRLRDDAEILDALVPLVGRMREDFTALPETIDHQTRSAKAIELDHMSLNQYFDRIGASGFVRDLLAVAYTTEYGFDPGEQSPLNLLTLFDLTPPESATDPRTFQPFGDSDERFKVRGGNQRITEELGRRVEGAIRHGHRLESLASSGSGYTLGFARESGGAVEERADFVLLTLPFSTLREVDLRIELPEAKKKAIAELGYGKGAKLLMSFDRRIWREQNRSGGFFTDTGPQSGWDNSRGQAGEPGGLTIFTGGDKSRELERDTPQIAGLRATTALLKFFPNANLTYRDRAEKFHWPSYPHAMGSYACYRPRQWTSIAGAESPRVWNVLFAGEHCSRRFQGFMNGAVETARSAVREALQTIGVRRD